MNGGLSIALLANYSLMCIWLVVRVVVYCMRFHLFIWSVFAPKV